MQIELNGLPVDTTAETLAALIDERGFDAVSVATAIDGVFIPRPVRAATSLRQGAKVEVLSPMQGG